MGLTKDLGALPRVITVSGNNVGINTTPNASFMLDVNGTGRFNGSLSTSSGSGLIIGGNSFAFGPSSVRGALHIVGSSDRLLSFGTNGNQDAYLYNSSSITQIVSTPSLSFVSGGPERMRIFSTGNVFIGSSPSDAGFRLDVNGTGRFSGDLLVKRNATGGFLSSWGVVAMGQSAALVGPPDANAILCANAYFDGTWKRMNTGVANILEMTVGGTNVQFFTSPSNVPGSSTNFIAGPFIANSGVSWTNGSSDVRQKKNFEPSQGLKEVLEIEAVKYHFNWDDDSSVKRLGFKAQNLQKIIPEMVSEQSKLADDGTPLLTITPDYLLPVLVKAIQELTERIKILENK